MGGGGGGGGGGGRVEAACVGGGLDTTETGGFKGGKACDLEYHTGSIEDNQTVLKFLFFY